MALLPLAALVCSLRYIASFVMHVSQLCAFFVRLDARVEIELHDKNKKNEVKLAKDVIVEFSTLNYWCAI